MYIQAPTRTPSSRSSESTGKTQLVLLLIQQLNLDNLEVSDIVAQLSNQLNRSEQGIDTSDEDSQSDMPDLLSADEDEDDDYEENDESSGEDSDSASEYDTDGEIENADTEDVSHENEVDPETLIIVGGVAKFYKDITEYDVSMRMSDEEYRVYISLAGENDVGDDQDIY